MSLAAPHMPGQPAGPTRLSCRQYARLIAEGVLPQNSCYELLDGVIVLKDRGGTAEDHMGHSPRHRRAVRRLTTLAARIDSDLRHVQIQLPIELGPSSTPEPDAAIIIGTDDSFEHRLPAAADVACVMEASESSLPLDAVTKLAIYAESSIPQYVLIDLAHRRVMVFTHSEKGYLGPTVCDENGTVRLNLGLGEFMDIAVRDLLG